MKNVSAAQKKRDSVVQLIDWYKQSSELELKEFVRANKINRSTLASHLGFARSCWGSNRRLFWALNGIESRMRSKGILRAEEPKQTEDHKSQRTIRNQGKRLNALEQQNASLKAQLDEAKRKLKKLGFLEEHLSETGRLPR